MQQQELITSFLMFGTATLLGFLIGLERSMGESENPHATIRDFVIFGLVGATSAFAARHYQNAWLVVGAFFGVLTLLISGYWAQHRRNADAAPGVTTEASAVVTFFLGVLIIDGAATAASSSNAWSLFLSWVGRDDDDTALLRSHQRLT